MRAASHAIAVVRHAFLHPRAPLSHMHALTQAQPRAAATIAHARATMALSLSVYIARGVLSPHAAVRQRLGHFERYEGGWRKGGARACSSVSSPPGIGVQAGQESAQEVRPHPRALWVKKQGDEQFTKVGSHAGDVDDLKKEIVKELGIEGRLSTVTLHVEGADGSLGPALDSRARMEAAGVVEGTSIVVKTPGAGNDALRATNLVAAAAATALVPLHVPLRGKKFTVNGAIEPFEAARYFFLEPDVTSIVRHIADKSIFMLHGPRGCGKTTASYFALQTMRNRGWYCLEADLNGIAKASSAAFWSDLHFRFQSQAAEQGFQLRAFASPAAFQSAFARTALAEGARVVLMFDEFDCLDDAPASLKEEFFGAIRDIKQHLRQYAIQSIFAVGPFSILFMEGKSGSPFNVRESLPARFLSCEDVSALFQQFSIARGVTLDDAIPDDVYELTAGHAGLVCACGRALESDANVPRNEARHITLAAWRDFRARGIVEEVLHWPTMRRMSDRLMEVPADRLPLLNRVLAHGVYKAGHTDPGARLARYFTAEGWLTRSGGSRGEVFHVTSPLLRNIALRTLADRRAPLEDPLPCDTEGTLIIPKVIATALRFWDRDTMLGAANASTKRSKSPLAGAFNKAVPSEASYHFQLFTVLAAWLRRWHHADIFPEADTCVPVSTSPTSTRKLYADMLLIGRDPEAPKHVLELVASGSAADIRSHYARTLHYMAVHAARGTCITFTAVQTAAHVTAVEPAALTWPTPSELADGLEAIHVVHDLTWTRAAVYAKSAGKDLPPEYVDLLPEGASTK